MRIKAKTGYLLKYYIGFLCLSLFTNISAQQYSPSIEAQIHANEVLQKIETTRIKSSFIKQNSSPKKIRAGQKANSEIGRTSVNTSVPCVDSSFRKEFRADNRSFSFSCSAKTSDDAILIGGSGRSKLEGPPYKFYSILSKFDKLGNHVWSQEIRSDVYYSSYIESIKELSDGSIIITGWYDNNLYRVPPTEYSDFFVTKLSATGNIIWFKTFHSQLNNNCSTNNIRFASVAEGANGDLVIAGTNWNCPYPKTLVIFKLNNSGAIQWKYSFKNASADAFAIGVFYEGDRVTVLNRSANVGSGTDGVIHVDLLQLNYNTGTFISHKGWKIDKPYPESFYSSYTNSPQAVKLNNGNYCIYGQVFGDLVLSTNDQPRFSVLEFDTNYDYVKGYTINSSFPTARAANKIKANRFGQVLYSINYYPSLYEKDLHIGSIDNGVIVNQRKREFRGTESFPDNFEIFDDGSYAYIHDLTDAAQTEFYLDYSLLHNSDTASTCLGLPTNFSHTVPVKYTPYDFTWVEINTNPVLETNNQGHSIIPINYTASPACFQKSFCDTIKIHGEPFSCNLQNTFTFTAFRNKACQAGVSWKIDPTAIELLEVVNDTTVNLKFNKPWQGWLYASINSSCGVLKDSLFLSVFPSPGPVNLGNDTTICPSNTLLVNAHKRYVSYLWNTGTTDSTLVVTSPGKYYVDVIDACGNSFSDTIVVNETASIPLSIGPDRIKCNSDTIHLNAPSGFLNYTWTNNYRISSGSARNVIVNPAIDTSYYLKAEKTPGCFAFDTIHIKVNHSQPINLGKDTSFCSGDSLLVDAGPGFINYAWTTGETSPTIKIKNKGVYSIAATDNNGCVSYDTLKVISLYNNPQLHLAKDSLICFGDIKILDAGAGYSQYIWNTGSTSQKLSVNQPGKYFVSVIDNNGCKGSDTVAITKILDLPHNFLPTDTSLCTYSKLVLSSQNNFSAYQWSTNSNTRSVTIDKAGTYWLKVSDQFGCKGVDSITINPEQCMEGFYIPNAFTPNNDGKNDEYRPLIFGDVTAYRFTIYNRWGEKVFESKEVGKGWQGVYDKIKDKTSTFVWTCQYQLNGQPVKFEKGTVTLVR